MTLTNCLVLSAALFAIGAYGVLARRNVLVMLMSVEVMLNAAGLAFISFARFRPWQTIKLALPGQLAGTQDAATGQTFVLLAMAVAAAEVAVGLALLIAFFRNKKTVDAGEMDLLKG